MNKQEKHVVIRAFARRYSKAKTKKQKSRILEEIVKLIGYCRKHAIRLLRKAPSKHAIRRHRPSRYQSVLPELKKLWVILNFACGKLLVAKTALKVPIYPATLKAHFRYPQNRLPRR